MKAILIKKDLFLKKMFKRYYYSSVTKIMSPIRLAEREIGYLTFDPEKMIRHLHLKNEGELRALILHEVPKSVYYSSAYYDDPSAPINTRVWKGGDLIFDIDLDHLPLVGDYIVTFCLCNNCKGYFEKVEGKVCPNCNSHLLEEIKMVTKDGLEYCKKEAIKLIEVLEQDFGILEAGFRTYFSGKRGFHVSVESSSYESADQAFRIELSNYMTMNGFKLTRILSKNISYESQIHAFPIPSTKGWLGRISRKLYLDKLKCSVDNLDEDYPKNLSIFFSNNKFEDVQQTLESIVKELGIGIDVAVTTDIHRIFRLPNTLHGDTGLLKKKIDNIDSFSPLTDAVAFSEEPIKIHVFYSPQFELKEQLFGPYKNQKVNLPEMAAVFLVALGLAEPLEA